MKFTLSIVLLLLSFTFATALHAQDETPEPAEPEPPAEEAAEDGDAESEDNGEKKDKEKTIDEITEESDRIDGLLTLFRDRKTGEVRLLLDQEDLNKEFLYFSYTENGPAAGGFFIRGSYQISTALVFEFRRFFNRIEVVEKNTRFYFDPEKAITKAANANVTDAVIFDQKIEAEDEDSGEILIQVDDLFLKESFYQLTPLPNPDRKPHEQFSVGGLSKEKSKIREIKNYPHNTDLRVEFVYENPKNYQRGGDAITNNRTVNVLLQHSITLAPENPIEPRLDDPRVGYFGHQVTDLSSTSVTPYRDIIERWRLEKKDPDAKLSEPVQPIVFWLENTTPVELRPIIEKAALRWNEAFEKAGFLNALQIKIQPDDADWDAGDIRYNVIRWVSSPDPRYGGYGPSFHDPRSGEILGADIMLEHTVIGSRLLSSDVLGDGASDLAFNANHPERCTAGLHARNETLFGMAALDALGAASEEKQRLLEEFLHFLTLHEIGHTLGLNHNFRSSHLHSRDEIYDSDATYPAGLYGSVMDYPAVPFAQPGEDQSQYWTTRPGPYDHWAIEFGYTPDLDETGLETILSRSTDPELAFANDADDMRSPGKAIDPRAMINDMSSDPIKFSMDQIQLVKAVQPRFQERLLKEGESYQYFLNGYNLSIRRFRDAVNVVSRYIGGVYVDRAMVGQEDSPDPLTPVSLADQKRAMDTLSENLFAPDAFDAFTGSAEFLLAQRRGFNHRSNTEDPKIHATMLGYQKGVLDHLLHSKVLARLTDTTYYGNEYQVDQLFVDLTNAVFTDDLNSSVNTFRQNLQLEYVDRLLKIVNGNGYDKVCQSMALNRLRWIEDQMDPEQDVDLLTRAHRENILYRIESGLDPRK